MSDAIKPTMKVSREGIVLIKSFEGFRPRAIRREDGGWVIGYGHTLSAREGASVSEADAELLLRYDLLPVEKTVNEAGSAVLNQHQFDALASFAFSVGVDPFRASDVLAHLTSGATDQVADALMGWPEAAQPQVALRRRAAERALFVADPNAPVAVSALLAAPLSQTDEADPPVAEAPLAPEPLSIEPEQAPQPATPAPEPDQAQPLHPRAAAVSALLGEGEAVPSAAEPTQGDGITTIAFLPPTDAAPPAANDAEAEKEAETETVPPMAPLVLMEPGSEAETGPHSQPEPQSSPEPERPFEPETTPASAVETVEPPSSEAPSRPETEGSAAPAEGLPTEPVVTASVLSLQRYSPYGAPMVGPLPFLQLADDRSAAHVGPSPSSPQDEPERLEPEVEIPAAEPAGEESPIVQPFALSTEVEPLVLIPPEDATVSDVNRPAWAPEERAEVAETVDGGLFGEDLSLTQGGAPIMRHGDAEVATPAVFDWSETGAFIIMGAVGLTAFGAAMAAFRLASEQTGGNETTIIAWVLAVIGAGCVGVSSFNLYRRWGLPGGDN